jgi:lipopolysaccharide export system protein LptA
MRAAIFFLTILLAGSHLWGQDVEPPKQRTTIDSDELEMQGTEDRNYFYFRGNVHVLGPDLEIRCNELTVTALRTQKTKEATLGEIGAVEKIVAQGNVQIEQAGRSATAGRVEVDPAKGTIRFLENPIIVQDENEATAYGFVFYTKEKRLEALNPPGFEPGQEGGRSTLTLLSSANFSMEVPDEEVTVDDQINRPSESASEDAGQTTEATSPEGEPVSE